MPLTAGTRLGPYEITAQIGVGGMGEVYRATDTNLKRQVAIKVLPEAVAADAERLVRFQREAEVLASLNHPNIAIIHGLEKSDGVTGLVMELVEGSTLADRITQGPIPIDEALPIAKQIAEALEGAHEQAIIHRDLKPANIKLRPDGTVKVLDFGLAKALDPAPATIDASQSPTVTSPAMTRMGVILGTAAYMSPEQARGKPVDKRTDIWAFGCVLYEMLAGRQAFAAASVSETLSEVLKSDPDWQGLPADTPDGVRRLLRRCLAKDQKRRLTDIHDARLELDELSSDESLNARGADHARRLDGLAGETASTRVARRRVWVAGAAAVIASAVVATTLTWVVTRPPPPTPLRVSRLTITPTRAAALTLSGNDRDVAITPDGSRVVYVGNNGTQLFVRALDALEPVAVFTGAPRGPFVSLDGQWIGFVDGNTALKKVAVTGGAAVTLTTLDQAPRGATWGPDDTIYVATLNATTGLQRVAAEGGSTTVLTRPDPLQGESDHLWPELLPGGRALLFTITAVTGGLDAAQVVVLDLETLTRTVLVRGGSHAHYVSSGPALPERSAREGGYLVYMVAGSLRAVAFDLARLETRGTPVSVIPEVVTTTFGAVDAVVAADGTLAYVSAGGLAGVGPRRTLVWVDRRGGASPIGQSPTLTAMRAYVNPRLSPDGTRIAVHLQDQGRDLWDLDLRRNTFTRVTFDPTADNLPLWTPDGSRVIFSSARNGQQNIFWQGADRAGIVEPLIESANTQAATDVSSDGRWLVFTETSPRTGEDVMRMALPQTSSGREPGQLGSVTPLVHSPSAERNGTISPDRRWLAYEANNSGPYEIYVRPFPDVDSGFFQVSSAGGTQPRWAPKGEELFYVSPTGALLRVGVERGSRWAASAPTLVVKEGYVTRPGGSGNAGLNYDISSDGQRFLLVKEGDGSDVGAVPPSLVVVQHWVDELKRLVPAN